MLIRVKARATQVRFDREYAGTVEVVIPDPKIIKTFTFTLTDPAGDNTRYEVLHDGTPFIIIQDGGPDDDMARQMAELPRGRQLMLSIFVDSVTDAYTHARRNYVDPEMRTRQNFVAALLEKWDCSIGVYGFSNQEYTSRVPEEFRTICDELRSLPPTPLVPLAAQ